MLINVLRDEQPTHVAVAFDVSRQTFRSRGVRRVQGQPLRDARRVQGPGPADQGGARRAAHPATSRRTGFEADDVIATLATQAARRGHRGADLLRRPRRLPAGHRRRHRALPDRGRLRAGPDDARRRSRRKYGVPPERYPDLAALVGETSDNLPGVPGRRARRPPPSGSTSTATSTASSPTSTRSRARRARRCASTSTTCSATAGSTQLVRDLDLAGRPDRPGAPGRGTASRCTQLFDGLEFRVLRDRLFETLERRRSRGRGAASTLDGARLGAGEVAGWLAEHAAGRRPGRRARRRAPGARGTGDVRRPGAGRRPTAPRRTSTSTELDAGGRGGARAPGWPTPRGPRCCTTPRARCWRWRRAGWPLAGSTSDTALAAYLVRPDQRSYDLADLTLRYLKRELRAEARRRRPGQLDPRRRRRRPATPTRRWCTPARCSTWPTRSTTSSRQTRRHRAARRRRAAAGRPARRDGADRHRRRRRPPRARWRRDFAAEVRDAAAEALTR